MHQEANTVHAFFFGDLVILDLKCDFYAPFMGIMFSGLWVCLFVRLSICPTSG